MDRVEKSVSRKLRRLYERLGKHWRDDASYTRNIFTVGKFAAQLVPFWVDHEYCDFQRYLYHRCGFQFQAAGKIELWMHTYYEIPSLSVWLEVGWRQAARAAQLNREGQQDYLLENGLCVLDILAMI